MDNFFKRLKYKITKYFFANEMEKHGVVRILHKHLGDYIVMTLRFYRSV